MPADRRRRYAVPVIAAALIALGAGVAHLGGSGRPRLPSRTAAQLAGDVLDRRAPAFSGSVAWTPDLGLPSLDGLAGGDGQGLPGSSGSGVSALVSSPQTFQVWDDGPGLQRVASISPLEETDDTRIGPIVWGWTSSTQRVTRSRVGGASLQLPHDPGGLGAAVLSTLLHHDSTVSVGRPVRVAGRAAYDLVLAPSGPAAAASTVARIAVAVDARTGVPLRVDIDARGQAQPALQVAFTRVGFGAPPRSVFAVPAGGVTARAVSRAPGRGGRGHPPSGPIRRIGSGWTLVVVIPHVSALGVLGVLGVPVSGRWGSGQLLSSSLLDALVLPGGTTLVGAVEPATLEADAAHLSGGQS